MNENTKYLQDIVKRCIERVRGVERLPMGTKKTVKKREKSEIGKELEEKIKSSKSKYTKSQQEILKQMKEKKEGEYNIKFQDSLKKAFSIEVEEGVTLIDEIASKTASTYMNMEQVSAKDAIALREVLGENKQKVDVELGGKIDIKKELENLVSESDF